MNHWYIFFCIVETDSYSAKTGSQTDNNHSRISSVSDPCSWPEDSRRMAYRLCWYVCWCNIVGRSYKVSKCYRLL